MFTHFFKELLKDCKEGHEAIFDNDFLKYLKKNDRASYEATILFRIVLIVVIIPMFIFGFILPFFIMPILIFLGLLAC